MLSELIRSFEKTADDAADLKEIFWHRIPGAVTSSSAVAEYVGAHHAIVFRLPDVEGIAEDLHKQGWDVFQTMWGPVVVDDSQEKRLAAKMKVISLASRDRASLGLMTELVEYIGRVSKRSPPKSNRDSGEAQNE
jgi:hypothetical protein